MDSPHSESSVLYTPQEYQAEQVYFEEYDTAMEDAINEADRYLEELQQMHQQQYQQQEIEEEDVLLDSEMKEEPQEETSTDEEYIIDENLLRLIVDVQSYLQDAPTDSPLLKLQYKMYTYFKHRISEQVDPSATY